MGVDMSNEEFKRIFSKNLKRIAYDRHKIQAEIAEDLHLKQATLSSWMNGTRAPNMEKIDMLCAYFGCTRTEMIDDRRGYANNADVNTLEASADTLFAMLNKEGQQAALQYMRFLLTDPKYKKEPERSAS